MLIHVQVWFATFYNAKQTYESKACDLCGQAPNLFQAYDVPLWTQESPCSTRVSAFSKHKDKRFWIPNFADSLPEPNKPNHIRANRPLKLGPIKRKEYLTPSEHFKRSCWARPAYFHWSLYLVLSHSAITREARTKFWSFKWQYGHYSTVLHRSKSFQPVRINATLWFETAVRSSTWKHEAPLKWVEKFFKTYRGRSRIECILHQAR